MLTHLHTPATRHDMPHQSLHIHARLPQHDMQHAGVEVASREGGGPAAPHTSTQIAPTPPHAPLAGVEWAAEREDAAARQDLELAAALQLFGSRMEELREQVRVIVIICQ